MKKKKQKGKAPKGEPSQQTKFRVPSNIKFGKSHGGQGNTFKPPTTAFRTQHKG